MDRYEVVTSDGETWGHVVGESEDSLIVEHGRLRKHRYALPRSFAEVDDDARVVRTTLSGRLLADSPEVGHGDVDEEQVAAYYGLAGGYTEPATEGYGELEPDDPALTADQQALRSGVTPAEQERAEIRKTIDGGETYGRPGRQIIPPDPHEVGGREVSED